jgi:hypothetical protein
LIACLTWLSNVVQFVKCVGGSPPSTAGELNLRPSGFSAPPADTRRVRLRASGASSRQARLGTDNTGRVKCLHVLSSFQRTGLAIRPAPTSAKARAFPVSFSVVRGTFLYY